MNEDFWKQDRVQDGKVLAANNCADVGPQRHDVITGERENRNRQLSALIAIIETDVQAE